jgi:biotin carboxyl carrier protein
VSSRGRPVRFTAVAGDVTHAIEVVELDEGRYEVSIDGRTRVVDSRMAGATTYSLLIEHASTDVSVLARGEEYAVETGGRLHRLRLLDERAVRRQARAGASVGGSPEVRAAMPGKVVAVLVEVGATVERGQGLLVIEAMKMENEIGAPRAGRVAAIRVQLGQTVEAGETLAVIE